MTQTSPESGTDTPDSRPPAGDDAPAVLLRNEDDTDHALDVCIADDETVLAEGCHTVAGDSQRTIAAATDHETLRVDLRADHGGTASLTVDMRQSRRLPEFVVRRKTIVVAGLS